MIPLPATLRPYLLGAAGIAILAAAIWVWRIDSLRASHKADAANVRREYTLFREQVEVKATQALIAQKAVNAKIKKDQEEINDRHIDALEERIAVGQSRYDSLRAKSEAYFSSSSKAGMSAASEAAC